MFRIPFLLLVGILLGSGAAAAEEGCVTLDCHASYGKAAYVHAPVEDDCTSCHELVSKQHPQGKSDFRLVATGADLCYLCHESKVAEARDHEPVKMGRCTACHAVHGSENEYLLVKPTVKLCLKCHTSKRPLEKMDNLHPVLLAEGCTVCHDPHTAKYPELLPKQGIDFCGDCHAAITAAAKSAKNQHGAMEGGCVACHDPHGTGNRRMFPTREEVFCASCHEEMGEFVARARHQHQPVAEGICWGCHDPHGSDYFRLLKASYPEPFYTGFDEDNYQLCFMCHDSQAFLYERTSELTGFRNGDRNLHFLHVNKVAKGRVCKTCHGVHGADQIKLVKSRIPGFGRWEIPINLQPGVDGATCTVGCHKPKTYDRSQPYPND